MPAKIKAEVLNKHYQEILNSAEQYAEYAMNYLKNMNILSLWILMISKNILKDGYKL